MNRKSIATLESIKEQISEMYGDLRRVTTDLRNEPKKNVEALEALTELRNKLYNVPNLIDDVFTADDQGAWGRDYDNDDQGDNSPENIELGRNAGNADARMEDLEELVHNDEYWTAMGASK